MTKINKNLQTENSSTLVIQHPATLKDKPKSKTTYRVNGYKLLNNFMELAREYELGIGAIAVYTYLINRCNKTGWQLWLNFDAQDIANYLGIKSLHTVYRCLGLLEKKQIISWKKGKHNKTLPKVSITDLQKNRKKVLMSPNDISNDTSPVLLMSKNDNSFLTLKEKITYNEEELPKNFYVFEEKYIKPLYKPYKIKRNLAGEYMIPGMKPGMTQDEKELHRQKWSKAVKEANRSRLLFNEKENAEKQNEMPGSGRQFLGSEEQPVESLLDIIKNKKNGQRR